MFLGLVVLLVAVAADKQLYDEEEPCRYFQYCSHCSSCHLCNSKELCLHPEESQRPAACMWCRYCKYCHVCDIAPMICDTIDAMKHDPVAHKAAMAPVGSLLQGVEDEEGLPSIERIEEALRELRDEL